MLLARRLAIVLALLMGLMALTVALAPAPETPRSRARTGAGPASSPASAGSVVQKSLFVTDDAEPVVVEAAIGDTVALEVHGTAYDGVELEGLDRFAAVSPEAPATFDLLADRAGSFPIVLTETDREIGRLEISPAR